MLKSGKGSRKSCRNVLGENILYRKNLSLAKEGSVLKAYTYFKKWEMSSAKGLTSLSEEELVIWRRSQVNSD